jgi:NAD(P)-dependent dehydrogenase (short-subunit alcohol dehydrogenase family)
VRIRLTGAIHIALSWSVDYPATKAALEAVTRCMAAQLGESHEATVNAINPGPVATDM